MPRSVPQIATARENRVRRDRLAHSEAKGDRHEKGQGEKPEREILGPRRTEPAVDEDAREEDAREKKDGVQPRLPVRGLGGLLEPDQQKGRDEQRARRVAQPPRQPDRPEIRPPGEAGETQTRGTDRGAQERARARREPGESEDVARPFEGMTPAREAGDQPRRDDRLERVSDRDAE